LTIVPFLRSSIPGKSAAVRRTTEKKFVLKQSCRAWVVGYTEVILKRLSSRSERECQAAAPRFPQRGFWLGILPASPLSSRKPRLTPKAFPNSA
jgi:hypothetical protein